MISIEELTYSDRNIYNAVCELLQQLTGKECTLTSDELEKIISTRNTILYVAIDEDANNKIVGMLSLVFLRKLTGYTVRVEDVVVLNDARKRGIGKELMLYAIQIAKNKGVKNMDLTSRPSRSEANNLYQSLGFELHNTNVYRLKIKTE
jgi:ribosomal protein S18 acetylase RimI-like enzyme